jgi:hypothetical protein
MDDKKKLTIIGALAVVLLGIGAFQFTKASAPPAPPAVSSTQDDASKATSGDDATKEQPKAEQQNDLVKGAYAARDPFKPLIDANAVPPQQELPKPPTTPLTTRVATGKVFPPLFGGIDKTGELPVANPGGEALKPVVPEFPYRLAGIILGRKPAAVFVDSQGNQRLVELGGSIDGDTRLVGLDREHVVLRYKDHTKDLTLGGGNTSAK